MLITLLGGPAHKKRARLLDERVGFISYNKERGHYAPVSGGLKHVFYWYDCPPPIAVGNKPVREVEDAIELLEGDD